MSNGHNKKNGKQKYRCKGCDKYGTLDAAPRYSEERKEEILKAYFERPSMRGIVIYQQTGQHQKVGKESGQTNHMERWNNTIRQWRGRLTRKTLSFSKSDFYNELVIHLFIVRYNISKSVPT